VLDGDSAPFPQKGHSPQLSAHFYCGQTAVCIRMPLGTEVGLSLGDIVLDGDPTPPPLKGHSPQFSANVRCGQTAGWSKMPLGMEVGLGPGNFVFDGNPALTRKGHRTSPFSAHVYCGDGRPSQLLLSSCRKTQRCLPVSRMRTPMRMISSTSRIKAVAPPAAYIAT